MEKTRPKITKATPQKDHTLLLTFENGEERVFDITPYLKNFFSELEDIEYFQKVYVENGSIAWPHGQDLAYDMLYYKSEPLVVSK
ncbi:DUF2442 domain-containing protein [Gracilimonas mengyeensis]|uniref:DUF2442 domain-containing protein n=1 Tax=Gracilimonas mengyeensis TaxID=1302730 RepID=A0A521B896_9BACT|nr:DUF2442 domain-containing protein [Gracilimonas mengyeensis]SMO43342.1 Protein of unknown function [Gracilimonas mengyeensis]